MKYTKFITFIVLLWITIPLYAQQYYSTRSTTVLSSNIEFSLIRNYDEKMFYYVRTQDSSFFALSSIDGTTAERAFIPYNYQVSDMEILGNYAYFCGKNTATNKGFIALFHIQNFISGSAGYRFCENFVTPGTASIPSTNITNIRRLCVYSGMQTPGVHLVAVCTGTNNNCLLEIIGVSPTEMSWNFNIGESSAANEIIHDVAVTNNYVVTVGSKKNGDGDMALRIYNKNSVFSSNICQTIYPFYDYNYNTPAYPAVEECLDDYHFAALGNDTVAILTTIRDVDTTPHMRSGVMLAMHDIPTMLNVDNGTTYSATIWSNDNTSNTNVSALRYDSQNRSVVGIVNYTPAAWRNPVLPGAMPWVAELNMNNSYTTVMARMGELIWHQNVDPDANNNRYFFIGYSRVNQKQLVLSMNRFNSYGCDNFVTMQPVICDLTSRYGFAYKQETKLLNILTNFGVICGNRVSLRTDTMVLQRNCYR